MLEEGLGTGSGPSSFAAAAAFAANLARRDSATEGAVSRAVAAEVLGGSFLPAASVLRRDVPWGYVTAAGSSPSDAATAAAAAAAAAAKTTLA